MIDPTEAEWWRGNPAVVLPEQLAIAVYTNQNDDIVIRQERAWDEDSDTVVIVSPTNVRKVAEAMLAEIGETIGGPAIAGLLPSPEKSRSPSAERQKRYRDRHRNGSGERDVTQRHAETPGDGAPLADGEAA